MSYKFSTLVLASALLCGTAAHAQTNSQDLRCLLASNVFAKSEKDPARQRTAQAAGFFYLGRVDGKLSPAQLKAQLLVQGKTLDATNLGQIMTECAIRLKNSSMAMQALGEELDKAMAK